MSVLLLPARVAFARREENDFEIVSVGIAKIERLDSGSGLNEAGNVCGPVETNWAFSARNFFKRLIHVAHHNRDVLKPQIVAP